MYQVAEGIYLLDAGTQGEMMASCVYLVMGERAALVDVGPTRRAMGLPERLSSLEIDAGQIAYIIPTHIHVDHAGATGYLSRLYPEARVVVHPAGARHLIDPSRLIESTRAVFGPNAEDIFGRIEPVPAERLVPTADGDLIDLGGGRRLRVIDTAGHAPHHQSFYDERTRGIFVGESMGIYHPDLDVVTPAIAPPLFDLFKAISSVRRMASVGAERFYYAHGGAQEHVAAVPESLVDAMLAWAEVVRDAMREDPSRAHVAERMKAWVAEELRAAAAKRGIAAPPPRDVLLSVGGLMGFFAKVGLDVDLRDGNEDSGTAPRPG